uniref:Uncharacterized protein n=2 Tax=Physcomitrium patens TaxID=3218 RepID=A0A7I4FUR5_PHYPA
MMRCRGLGGVEGMARTKTRTEKKRKHAASGVAKKKLSPAVKFAGMEAAAGMEMSIASGKMSEKMAHFRAYLMLKIEEAESFQSQ